jgi:hypothetical protein
VTTSKGCYLTHTINLNVAVRASGDGRGLEALAAGGLNKEGAALRRPPDRPPSAPLLGGARARRLQRRRPGPSLHQRAPIPAPAPPCARLPARAAQAAPSLGSVNITGIPAADVTTFPAVRAAAARGSLSQGRADGHRSPAKGDQNTP